jgi:hypothetical protein
MTELRKISMFERREVVDKVGLVVGEVQMVFPTAEIMYVTMFPRFVEVCCKDHMTEDDVVVVDSIRSEVDRDVEELLQEMDGTIRVVQWWEIIGLGSDMTHDMIRSRGVVDKDGVHLTLTDTDNTNRVAAASLGTRLSGRGVEMQGWGGGTVKRARW